MPRSSRGKPRSLLHRGSVFFLSFDVIRRVVSDSPIWQKDRALHQDAPDYVREYHQLGDRFHPRMNESYPLQPRRLRVHILAPAIMIALLPRLSHLMPVIIFSFLLHRSPSAVRAAAQSSTPSEEQLSIMAATRRSALQAAGLIFSLAREYLPLHTV